MIVDTAPAPRCAAVGGAPRWPSSWATERPTSGRSSRTTSRSTSAVPRWPWTGLLAAVAVRRPRPAAPGAGSGSGPGPGPGPGLAVARLARPGRPLPPTAVPDDGERDEERALVERARHDRGAFAELYRRHVQAVFGCAYRLTGSQSAAEDITSATFERALRGIATFRWQGSGVRPWLLRIAANEATDHYRRHRRSQTPVVQGALRDLSTSDPFAPAEGPFDQRQLAAVRAALDELPPHYREVIALRYLAGLDADAAATALGCSKATLAVTLHRALGALRRTMTATVAQRSPS